MKFCTLAELSKDGTVGKIIEVSLVGDDHLFGPSKDRTQLHIEGGGMTITPMPGRPEHEAVGDA